MAVDIKQYDNFLAIAFASVFFLNLILIILFILKPILDLNILMNMSFGCICLLILFRIFHALKKYNNFQFFAIFPNNQINSSEIKKTALVHFRN